MQAGELFDYSNVLNNSYASVIAFFRPGQGLPLFSAMGILLWSLYLIILLAGSMELSKTECTAMEDYQENRLGTNLNFLILLIDE